MAKEPDEASSHSRPPHETLADSRPPGSGASTDQPVPRDPADPARKPAPEASSSSHAATGKESGADEAPSEKTPQPAPDKHTLAHPGSHSDPYRADPPVSGPRHDEDHEVDPHSQDGHEEDPYHPHDDHGEHHDDVGVGVMGEPQPEPGSGQAPPSGPAAEYGWEDDEGGGPIKSFLEHLEDLRWVIIRCLASLVIGMVVCLVAGNKVVELLKTPLKEAQRLTKRPNEPMILIQGGTNRWVLNLDSPRFGSLDLGSNQAIKLTLVPQQMGTNLVLVLKPVPLDPKELPPSNRITLKNLGPISPFAVALKIALFGGIGLASPFILFFIGQFVVPALHAKEKRYLYRALAIGSVLFFCGVLFCYFFMLKVALNAAVKFSQWMNFEADIWRAEEYIGFVVKFMLGMGLSFELPVVLLTLVKLDLLDYPRMVKFRPYWVIVNLAIASMLTPPDPFSMLLMAVPMQLLFELSLLIARRWWKQDQRRLAEEAAAEG